MIKQVRTYKVRGSRRDGYDGYSTDTIEVEAFTAADALVQVELEHGTTFKARSIVPVEPAPLRCNFPTQGKGLGR